MPRAKDQFGNASPFGNSQSGEPSITDMIRRTAEIKDELESRGIDPLIAELEDIRAKVKEIMANGGPDIAFDETSGWEAVLSRPRRSDVWSADKLRKMLKPRQRKRYLIESISLDSIHEGIQNGDLKMSDLQANEVVVKGPPGSRALSIRKRKGGK